MLFICTFLLLVPVLIWGKSTNTDTGGDVRFGQQERFHLASAETTRSFQKFVVIPRLCTNCSFWYAVEDVLHSALFVVKHEHAMAVRIHLAMLAQVSTHSGCIVLDLGCNGGYYTLSALAIGCRVIAVDAQRRCLERLETSIAASGFDRQRAHLIWTAVQAPNSQQVVRVGATKCSGVWSAVKESDWINKESEFSVDAPSSTLADILLHWPTVTTMKVDIEGAELEVMKQSIPLLFRPRIIADVFVEVWGVFRNTTAARDELERSILEILAVYNEIIECGYEIRAASNDHPLTRTEMRRCVSAPRCGDWHIVRIPAPNER
jgi:FkbM family methyltransferase